MSALKTSNLRFDLFIGLVCDKFKYEDLTNLKSVQTFDLIQNIQQIYSDKYDQNICEFFKQLTYTHYDRMAMVASDIFEMLNLKLSEAKSCYKMIFLN